MLPRTEIKICIAIGAPLGSVTLATGQPISKETKLESLKTDWGKHNHAISPINLQDKDKVIALVRSGLSDHQAKNICTQIGTRKNK